MNRRVNLADRDNLRLSLPHIEFEHSIRANSLCVSSKQLRLIGLVFT